MNPIIYVDGGIADGMGQIRLRQLGQLAANNAMCPVDVLVHGESKHHASLRLTCKPEPRQ